MLVATLTFALAATPAAPVRFTADQCRVLRQLNIDVTGLNCPPPRKSQQQQR